MIKHINLKIYGRVQGVGFRYSAQKKAIELGIKGFVKNQFDGSVYAEVEAEEDILNEFVLWCRKGPSWSRVEKIETEESPILNYKDFKIM